MIVKPENIRAAAELQKVVSQSNISQNHKKVAFGDCTFSGRLSCYSVISSLQISDDISFIIKKSLKPLSCDFRDDNPL